MRITGRKNVIGEQLDALESVDASSPWELVRIHTRKEWEAADYINNGPSPKHYFLQAEAAALNEDVHTVATRILESADRWAKNASLHEAERIATKKRIRDSLSVDSIKGFAECFRKRLSG